MDVFRTNETTRKAKMEKTAEFYKISVAELEQMYRNMEARRESEELRILSFR